MPRQISTAQLMPMTIDEETFHPEVMYRQLTMSFRKWGLNDDIGNVEQDLSDNGSFGKKSIIK